MDINKIIDEITHNKITTLKLSHLNSNNYLDNIINSLKNNISLYLISFYKCNLNDEDIIKLVETIKLNKYLEYLYLQYNNFTNTSLLSDYLIDNNCLISLDLGGNKIKDINPLVEILKSNHTLKYLYLNDNQISDIIPLINLLKINNTLKCINLYKNYFYDIEIFYYIIDVIKINKELHTLQLSVKYLQFNKLNKKNKKKFLKTIKSKVNEIKHKTFYLDLDFNNITFSYFLQK